MAPSGTGGFWSLVCTSPVASVSIGGMRVDPKSMAPLLDVLFSHKTKLVASALGLVVVTAAAVGLIGDRARRDEEATAEPAEGPMPAGGAT